MKKSYILYIRKTEECYFFFASKEEGGKNPEPANCSDFQAPRWYKVTLRIKPAQSKKLNVDIYINSSQYSVLLYIKINAA